MAGLSMRGLDLMLDSGFAPPYVSLHTGDHGDVGGSEIHGGNPTYQRVRVSWSPSSGGTRSVTGEVVFDVPQNTSPTHLGYWSARSGGVFYGSRALEQAEMFVNQGTLAFPPASIVEVLS